MINMGHMIRNPRYNQTFTVTRSTGSWVNGTFVTTTDSFQLTGIIKPANTKDIQMVPQADIIKGLITILAEVPLNTTQANPSSSATGGLSDEVTWKGEQYKVIQNMDYTDYGFFKAIATRKLGA